MEVSGVGLNIIVGILADVDEEGQREYQSQFSVINRVLLASGLPEHREPVDLGNRDPLELEMYGYSGLHYLRRIAAHLWAGRGLPRPGADNAAKDPVMGQYYDSLGEDSGQFAGSAAHRGTRFDHLLFHSDAEGFYVPIEFKDVIVDDQGLGIPGGMLGSSQALREECRTLARVLDLPLDLDPESNELREAADSQGEGDARWQQYGVESFTCLRLFHASEASIQLGAAIVFA